MGARHQAYIVARVVSHRGQTARYRCVGALHDQWCSGLNPPRAALRFVTLIKQPANSELILEELRALGSRRYQDKEHQDIPCPFTQFLCSSAWGADLDDPRHPHSRSSDTVCNLSADMSPADGDNNDGITVIDITDPEKPTCCFIIDIYNSALVPRSAEQYMNEYGEHLEALIRSFDAIPIMSQEVVDESWSIGSKSPRIKLQPKPLRRQTPSLVELTLKPAFEQAFVENNADLFDFILMDPKRMDIAKDIIHCQNPVSDGAFTLLQKLVSVQKDRSFDLSGFSLSGKQIVDLLALCEGSEVTSLKLSRNARLKIGDLEQILQVMPKSLRRLLLLDTGIIDTDIVSLLRTKPSLFYHLESIIHPAFLSGLYKKGPAEFHPSFTHMTTYPYRPSWTVSIPYFTPNTLAQGLTDYVSPIAVGKTGIQYFCKDITAAAAYATSSRISETWGERSVAYIPRMDSSLFSDVRQLRKGEWVLFFGDEQQDYSGRRRRCLYAFIRANKEGEQFLSADNSSDTKTKTKDILLKPNLFDVFDVRGFFEELELEGRPSPDPKVLEKLFALFTASADDDVISFIGHERIIEILESSKRSSWQ